jgi:hypothetical protein
MRCVSTRPPVHPSAQGMGGGASAASATKPPLGGAGPTAPHSPTPSEARGCAVKKINYKSYFTVKPVIKSFILSTNSVAESSS